MNLYRTLYQNCGCSVSFLHYIPHNLRPVLIWHFTPSTTVTLAHCGTKVNTKGKLKESKVFTSWILLLICTRLGARGCHWYKVWTFLSTGRDMEKAPGGTVSEKMLLQPCDWSVDLKLWWKRAKHLSLSGNWCLKCYICMAIWKCITFYHTALSTLSKVPLLQCYKNTSRGVLDLWAWVWVPVSLAFLSTSAGHTTPSPRPTHTFPGSEWPLSNQPLLNTQHRSTRHTENISTQRGKGRNTYRFFWKCYTCRDTLKCKACKQMTLTIRWKKFSFNML